jgi:hypothetical protein
MPVSNVEQGDRIVVGTPYRPNFPALGRPGFSEEIGMPADGVWIFDVR